MYCDNGNLVEKCQICGCEEGYVCQDDSRCVSILQGDVNGDCKVDIFDLATVGLAYGSQPGDTNWNPNADVNNDGKVDIFDLAMVGLNYGRECWLLERDVLK